MKMYALYVERILGEAGHGLHGTWYQSFMFLVLVGSHVCFGCFVEKLCRASRGKNEL